MMPERKRALIVRRETNLKKQFVLLCPSFINRIQRIRKKVLLPEFLPDNKTIKNYFRKEMRKAKRKRKGKNREDLHRYRKHIKKLMYVFDAFPKRIQKKVEWHASKMDGRMKRVGEWHDTYVAMQFCERKKVYGESDPNMLRLQKVEDGQYRGLIKKS